MRSIQEVVLTLLLEELMSLKQKQLVMSVEHLLFLVIKQEQYLGELLFVVEHLVYEQSAYQ